MDAQAVAPADWAGLPHERPGLCLPRAHQLPSGQVVELGPRPATAVSAHHVSRETWPTGLRSMLGMTTQDPTPSVAPGWWFRVLRAVGPMERSASSRGPAAGPRRWVMVESIALRLRGDVVDGFPQLGAVAVWTRPVVDLRRKPSWSIELCKLWPLTPAWLPADVPRDIGVAELGQMIRRQ